MEFFSVLGDIGASANMGIIAEALSAINRSASLFFGFFTLAFGALNCFLGYKLFKFWMGLCGFVFGGLGAFALGGLIGEGSPNEAVMFICGLLGGALCAFLSIKLYKLGVFVMLLAMSFVALILLTGNGPLALIVGIIVAVTGVYLVRPVIIISTAISGGISCGMGLMLMVSPSTTPLFYLFSLAFIIAGMMMQFKHHPKPPTAQPAPAGAAAPLTNAAAPLTNAAASLPNTAEPTQAPTPTAAAEPSKAPEGYRMNLPPEPERAFCTHCGAAIPKSATICDSCGTAVHGRPAQKSSTVTIGRFTLPRKAVVLGGVMLVIVVVIIGGPYDGQVSTAPAMPAPPAAAPAPSADVAEGGNDYLRSRAQEELQNENYSKALNYCRELIQRGDVSIETLSCAEHCFFDQGSPQGFVDFINQSGLVPLYTNNDGTGRDIQGLRRYATDGKTKMYYYVQDNGYLTLYWPDGEPGTQQNGGQNQDFEDGYEAFAKQFG